MEDWGLVVPVLIDCPHGCISFMAGRRYVRDNKGRFASTGATARGGRLATASGNKRATQTMQAEGGAKGTIGKPKGLKPTAAKPAASGVSAIPKGATQPLNAQLALERKMPPALPAAPTLLLASLLSVMLRHVWL
jgi:hypothetical protein